MSVSNKQNKQGFTLVELLVTITIFVLLTGVVLLNQSKFDSTILLTNLAYDTALTVRQAQTYGINIREFIAGSGSNFNPYGVHFDLDSPKSFILFTDLDEDGIYDGADDNDICYPTDGCVSRYSIKRGNYISDICINDDCDIPVNSLDILFKRANPDAKIYIEGDTVTEYARAEIVLTGVDGSERRVGVQANGLIEIIN